MAKSHLGQLLDANLEDTIRDDIYDYLTKAGVFVWRDNQSKRHRQIGVAKGRKGIADILGIYRGWPLAIEVKAPKGVTSVDQDRWLDQFRRAGGIAFIAKSVEEVIAELSRIPVKSPHV
jgi:hypothetical protein